MQIHSKAALAALSAVVALSVGLTGCSSGDSTGSDSTTATAASTQDASTLLRQASEASKQITGAHFVVETNGKVPNLPLTKAAGDINVKPAVAATGTATVSVGGTVEGRFVYTDGTMYSDILTGKFVDYGDGSSIFPVALLFDSAKGIPNVLTKVIDPKTAGAEEIDGEQTTKVTGKVRTEEVSALTGARVVRPETKDLPIPVTAWIQSTGEHQLVRLKLAPTKDATLSLTFSEWGKKVEVTKPQVAPTAAAPSAPAGTPRG